MIRDAMDRPADLAWMVRPEVSPWVAVQVLLIAVGLVAMIHIVHHAIHYPLRESLRAWWERWEDRRRPELRMPDTYRPGNTDELRRRLLQARNRGARA